MAFIVIRSVILYFVVIIAIRVMGKRQIGQLQPTELVVTILISDLATMPMQNTDLPLLAGVLPIMTLCALEIAASLLALKLPHVRKALYGSPVVIVSGGEFLQYDMQRARVSIDDVTEAMHTEGITDLKDLDYVILETNGHLSVIPKDGARKGAARLMIADGKALEKDEALAAELARRGLTVRDTFIASRSADGGYFIVAKEGRREAERDIHKRTGGAGDAGSGE